MVAENDKEFINAEPMSDEEFEELFEDFDEMFDNRVAEPQNRDNTQEKNSESIVYDFENNDYYEEDIPDEHKGTDVHTFE